jgi:hypothetical protein
MRFVPGTVLASVIVLAFLAYRLFGATDTAPPRDFLELELLAADNEHTGTCYSLSTVLIANTIGYSNATVSWHRVVPDTWTRRSEEMVQSTRGPTHVWQSITFRRENERILPVAHDSAPDPGPTLVDAIDQLLHAPIERGSTRVQRCLAGGASYTPKR